MMYRVDVCARRGLRRGLCVATGCIDFAFAKEVDIGNVCYGYADWTPNLVWCRSEELLPPYRGEARAVFALGGHGAVEAWLEELGR